LSKPNYWQLINRCFNKPNLIETDIKEIEKNLSKQKYIFPQKGLNNLRAANENKYMIKNISFIIISETQNKNNSHPN